jgi:hypothetical protein
MSVETAPLGTEIEVQVRMPATTHHVTVQQLKQWCDAAGSPAEVIRKG